MIKKLYRCCIKSKNIEKDQSLSDSLLYSLYNGKGNQFWKTWKGKVCGSEKAKVNIEGASADISASEIFKLHFEKTCSTVDIDYEKCMQQKFNELLNIRRRNNTLYYNNYLDRSVFNAMLIDMAVSKLNNSTAVGVDYLQKQHLIYCMLIQCCTQY